MMIIGELQDKTMITYHLPLVRTSTKKITHAGKLRRKSALGLLVGSKGTRPLWSTVWKSLEG